jgi:hypothetical protein
MSTYMLDSAAEQDERLFECPACGLPAQIEDRFTLAGAPSPVEHVKLVCVACHWCTPPVELAPRDTPAPPLPAVVAVGLAEPCRDYRSAGDAVVENDLIGPDDITGADDEEASRRRPTSLPL